MATSTKPVVVPITIATTFDGLRFTFGLGMCSGVLPVGDTLIVFGAEI